jgi:glutathione synthase/RimK-type ligase-like ATP-grasp enzyme
MARHTPREHRALVALATCRRAPDLDGDGPALIAALAALNITATPEIWDAPGTDWSAIDLVVIRATWDYAEQRAAFLDWARDVPRLANPYGVIEWNTDKTYLADLAAAGVATIPTSWYRPGSAVELPPGEIVVKPSVGAGARHSGHYGPTDRAAARDHVTRLLAEGRTVMVQPYLAQLEDSGERGLVYLGDRYSHAIAKPAILSTRGPYVEGTLDWDAAVAATTATDEERAFAESVLDAVPGGREQLLYARVDLVPDRNGDPLLIELETTEPRLYVDRTHGTATAFAAVVAARLDRT